MKKHQFFIALFLMVSNLLLAQNPIFKHPSLPWHSQIYSISPDGNYLAMSYNDCLQVTIWDMRTMEQKYNFVRELESPALGPSFEFDFDSSSNKPLIVGHQRNSSRYHIIDGDDYILDGTGMKINAGAIEFVENRTLGMYISRHESLKNGNPNYKKPLWAQYQLFNIDIKKWRTKRFEGAGRVIADRASELLLVYYPKKVEIYKTTGILENITLSKTIKGKFSYVKRNLKEPKKIYLLSFKKKGSSLYIKDILGVDLTSLKSFKIKEEIKTFYNRLTPLSNVKNLIPSIEKIKENDFEKAKLTVTNAITGEQKSVFITAETKEEHLALKAKVDEYHKIKSIANEKVIAAKYANQVPMFQEFDRNFDQAPSRWKLDYSNVKGRSLNSLALSKKLFGNTSMSISGIAKLVECDNYHAYLLLKRGITNGSDNSSFGVLITDKYGNKKSYKNVGTTQKARGKFTLITYLDISINGNSWSIKSLTKTAGKDRNENYNGSCY